MNEGQYTELPWAVGPYGGVYRLNDDGIHGPLIVSGETKSGSLPNKEANEAFVVEAVNAYNLLKVQNEWLKDRLAYLQLPSNSPKKIEEWLVECGMPPGEHKENSSFVPVPNTGTFVPADKHRALIETLVKALDRQGDNMAFVINHVTLPDQWYEKFQHELEEDRKALAAAKEISA